LETLVTALVLLMVLVPRPVAVLVPELVLVQALLPTVLPLFAW